MDLKSRNKLVVGVLAGTLVLLSFTAGNSVTWKTAPTVHAEGVTQPVNHTITVSGQGEVKAEPDVAYVSVGVETRGKTAAEAQKANAASFAKVKKVLFEQYKLAAADVKTSGFQVQPEYDYTQNKQKLIGYVATHTLEVTYRKLDELGALLDGVSAAGANRVNQIQFSTEKKEAYELQALEKAMVNAEAKAKVLAKSAKRELKGVSSIVQTGNQPVPYFVNNQAMADTASESAGGTSIERGQITITTNVSVQYDF
ncbi:SIMPL domain-containing protein [Paenibacillus gansuensis]|uniref:SIMPL domain-containing protein n=1 Tax=Paenibacillus gansuensis TaxID=306542 RepID=A0ABW5PHD8_9BACL